MVEEVVASEVEVGKNWKSERRRSAHLLPENVVEAPEFVAAPVAVVVENRWIKSFLEEEEG